MARSIQMINIALDVMGGDHGPEVIIDGAIQAARAYGVSITLVGKPDVIEAELAKHDTAGLNLPIAPAPDVIEMRDKPTAAVRAKPNSSMVIASRLVRNGEAQAFVTAGNTGAAMAAGILNIGRIKGILRPALLTPFPTRKGACVILDVGANPDVRPEHLQQFAIMGSIYSRHMMSVPNPRVCLLSNGGEAGKGNQLVTTAYPLLERTPGINFQGNAESQDVMDGKVDVLVTDGFSGNIFLKTAEAAGAVLQRIMIEELRAGFISTLGAFLAKGALRRIHSRIDDSEYGGAALLGLSGLEIVAHGRSRANAIYSALRFAKQGIESHLIEEIKADIDQIDSPPTSPENASSLNITSTHSTP
ncbi:MAG: phosphate acyltransferase PlsX [Hyphomicrobiales bacterium]